MLSASDLELWLRRSVDAQGPTSVADGESQVDLGGTILRKSSRAVNQTRVVRHAQRPPRVEPTDMLPLERAIAAEYAGRPRLVAGWGPRGGTGGDQGGALPAIEARGVRKVFSLDRDREVVAIDDVTMRVDDGEFVAIVGPSGCGKSTFLYMVGGFVPLSAGELLVGGTPVGPPSPDRGLVFQHFALFPWLTVRQNVMYGLEEQRLSKADCRRIAEEYIRLVKLNEFEDAFPKQLSGGMKQRVAIARTLAFNASVLLMDEPFGALDAQTRAIMQDELHRIFTQQRKTVLFVTHDVREAVYLADRVVVMSARPGRVKAVIDTRLAEKASVDAMTETEEFSAKVSEIWSLVKEEVEQTLEAAGAR